MNISFSPEQLAAAGKTNVETLLKIANIGFSSAERLTALNLNTARNLLEETIDNTKTLLSVKDAQSLASTQTSLLQPLVEKVIDYNRTVYEILSQGQEEVSRLFEGQLADINKTLSSTLDKAAQSAPAGSDIAVTAVKTAIAAANSAYDSYSKAAKQAVEIAEKNISAATKATVGAVSSVSPSSSNKSSTRKSASA